MKREKIAAIDVGTTKVCTIMADVYGNDSFRIVGVGVTPSHGLHKGLVVNINEAKESIRKSIRMAEQSAGYKLESAYIGVTGRHMTSTNNRGSIAITRNNQLVRTEDLKRVLDVARGFKVTSDQRLLHVIPRTYVVDGQDGVKNPIGMHGFRLDVETHIITAAITSIQNLTKCIRAVGVDVDDLIMEPLASAEAVLDPEEKQDGVILADIGGGTTDIAVFKDSTIYHTSVLPVAGYQVTRDISVGLGISYELAEEMKKKYGNVMPEDEGKSNNDMTLTQDGHSISYSDLSEIIRVRVEELLRLIVLELPQANYAKLVPSGLVLTGGGANLHGIAELAEGVTRLPVRVGKPISLYGVSDTLNNPAYATGVGLLLWKMHNEGTQSWQNTRENSLRRFFSNMFRLFQN
ncbi:MAG: cell division protein FtsA [Chloroflexi bacterium RBG_16_50_9]|nr:MAG: cell division protein FtsA [Chloroflexi bacterium RBG_16_50_9]